MNKLVTRLTSAAAACLVVVAGVAVAQSNDGKGTTGPDTGASPTLPDANNTMPAAPSGTTSPSTSSTSTSTPSTVNSNTSTGTTPSTGATGTSSYSSTPSTTDSTLPARSDRN